MDIKDIIKQENKVYGKTPLLTDNIRHYCPGCTHGTVHKIIAEVIEEMGIQDKTIGISPVGCAVFAYNYIDIDWEQAAHGRAPALATATKRLNPDKYVFTYQGDGDLASKSSIYELPEAEPVFCLLGTNCANSAFRLKVEGAVASTVGILLRRLVS